MNKQYCYRIRAFKDIEFANHSDYSNEVCTLMPTFIIDFLSNLNYSQIIPIPLIQQQQ